ncbi:MAG: hypothetical protein P4M13_05125 [Alphaproteobacteria bacterium]|nr:hypothetical protein [Alphaproteobacteria bacterium]
MILILWRDTFTVGILFVESVKNVAKRKVGAAPSRDPFQKKRVTAGNPFNKKTLPALFLQWEIPRPHNRYCKPWLNILRKWDAGLSCGVL